MKRPVATIAGRIGTKTSPKVRIARWNQLPCLAASAFCSSFDAVGRPLSNDFVVNLVNSTCTQRSFGIDLS